jgi:fructosamine-3-kinase
LQWDILRFTFYVSENAMSAVESIAAEALRLAGDATQLRGWEPVNGGMISQAARIASERGEYLLKWGGRGLARFFEVEARGLALLAAAGTVRVPAVLAWRDPEPTTDEDLSETVVGRRSSVVDVGFILLEWLSTPPRADRQAAFEILGRQLAALHRATALRQAERDPPAYGLDHDNYIGIMPQLNGWMASWAAFFRERRLRVQGELARRKGYLFGERERRLEQLLERLDTWLGGHVPPPALLHGDLWAGNVLVGLSDAPALIDPAVSYGDREAELAYTALFGGFPDGFYRAYEEVWPLSDGWQERRALYNLYHLLNHLNHFGERYGDAVDATLQRYVE